MGGEGMGRVVKIAAGGAGGGGPDVRGPELLGDEVDDALLCLEGSGDAEEGGGLGEDGVSGEDAGPEDDVHEACLVHDDGKRACVRFSDESGQRLTSSHTAATLLGGHA